MLAQDSKLISSSYFTIPGNPPLLQRYPFPIALDCTTISINFIPIVHAYHHFPKIWTCSTQATPKSKTETEEIVNHLSTSTAKPSTLDT